MSSKKGEKQGISFRANHRNMSTRNRCLFEHLAVFALFCVQEPRQTLKMFSFPGVQGFVRGEGQQKAH